MGRSKRVNTKSMTPVEKIASSDLDYVAEVVELAERAKAFLSSKRWCKEIVKGWLDFACGYIIGVFYFELVPAKPDVPDSVWVIVGDLPSAYLAVEFCSNGDEAMEGYVAEMQEWVDRVMDGRPLDDDVIPVNVPPTEEWAKELQWRLDFIKRDFLGQVDDKPEA